ncbi:MAG: hypothetical protein ACI3ZQ_04870 [Candidatus Cryptobacteroides sp.]
MRRFINFERPTGGLIYVDLAKISAVFSKTCSDDVNGTYEQTVIIVDGVEVEISDKLSFVVDLLKGKISLVKKDGFEAIF